MTRPLSLKIFFDSRAFACAVLGEKGAKPLRTVFTDEVFDRIDNRARNAVIGLLVLDVLAENMRVNHINIFTHGGECLRHDRLHRVLPDLLDKAGRLGIGLQRIDRFVQIEHTRRLQDRTGLGAFAENLYGIEDGLRRVGRGRMTHLP